MKYHLNCPHGQNDDPELCPKIYDTDRTSDEDEVMLKCSACDFSYSPTEAIPTYPRHPDTFWSVARMVGDDLEKEVHYEEIADTER